MNPAPVLRPAEADDDGFLFEVMFQTRRAEFAPLGWPEPALRTFLEGQHRLQDRAYRSTHPAARFDLVLLEGEPVGRIYVDRAGPAIELIDIALLPEHRGQGLGRQLLAGLLAEADAAGRAIVLHVDPANPVQAWYRQLGFLPGEAEAFHLPMRRPPAPAATPAARVGA